MAKALVELVEHAFPRVVLSKHSQHGDETIVVDPAKWHDVAAFLKSDPKADMTMLSDLTAVDYLGEEPRFEVVGGARPGRTRGGLLRAAGPTSTISDCRGSHTLRSCAVRMRMHASFRSIHVTRLRCPASWPCSPPARCSPTA